MKADISQLAHSWIMASKQEIDSPAYEKLSWAVDEVIDNCIDNPERAFDLIFKVLEIDDSEEIIKALGAGPLEDLMVNHASRFIDRIEKEANSLSVFRKVMQNVWLDEDDGEYRDRFYQIADIKPPAFKDKKSRG